MKQAVGHVTVVLLDVVYQNFVANGDVAPGDLAQGHHGESLGLRDLDSVTDDWSAYQDMLRETEHWEEEWDRGFSSDECESDDDGDDDLGPNTRIGDWRRLLEHS